MNSLKNHLLISVPHMNDDIFGRSVIYICEHNLEGAMGLIINKPLDDYIFKGQMYYCTKRPITSQQYARIVKGWLTSIGVADVSDYSTHSMRKTKASVIYTETKDVDAVRRLLGQSSVIATSAYLGVTDNSALQLAKSTVL